MRRTPRLVLVSLLTLLSCSGQARAEEAPAGPPGVSLAIGPAGLAVQGAEPGGQVAWFGVEREVDSEFSVSRRAREGVVRAAADGSVRIPLDPPPAARAVWVVVDLKSGDFAAGAPDGYRLDRLDRARTPSRGDAKPEGEDDGLLDVRSQIEGLMVRPGEGVWRFAGGDGGPDDDDRTHNGRLRLALPTFRSIGASPKAPSKIEGRDLWFVIDPLAMNLSVLKGGAAQ
jgi:hypothetical protein